MEKGEDDDRYALNQVTQGDKGLLKEWSDFGIQHLVHHHFSPVEIPQDGDLVVYYDKNNCPAHSGVIRIDQEKLEVESKWGGLQSPYVFKHRFFVMPYVFGTLAKVYRFNKGAIYEDPLPPRPEQTLYIQVNDAFKFVSNPANQEIRRIIEGTTNDVDLVTKFPQIQALEIAFNGQCTLYAIFKTLPGYEKKLAHEMDLLGYGDSKILEQYYTKVSDPQPGDLAVYSTAVGERVHMGIYLELDLIESKWGKGRVYRHPFFYVDPKYGDNITFYRLKLGAKFVPSEIDSCSIM